MGRMYRVSFTAYSLTAAGDFFEIVAASNKPIRLHEVVITQSTEAGDAAAEQMKIEIKRATSGFTSGSGGSSGTVTPLDSADAAAGATAEVKNTTQAAAGSGALTTIQTRNVHVANGFHYLPTPECQEVFRPTEACIVSLGAAPADSITFDGHAIFEEF